MPKVNKKVQVALQAIDNIFGDTSVSPETTLDQLEEIQADLEMKVDCLKNDIRKKG